MPLDLANYIRQNQIRKPNRKKPVTEVRIGDIILFSEEPCEVADIKLRATKYPRYPDVRFQGYSVFDGREWEIIFRYADYVDVGTFTEDANIYTCVVLRFLKGGMLLEDTEDLSIPFEIKFPNEYFDKRTHEMYQKAVEDGKEMMVRVRDLLGHKAVLSMKIADADDLEVMEPKRGAIIEQ